MSSLQKSIFWFGRIGSSRPGRAVRCRTARKADSRPAAAPPLERSRRFQAGLDRPSTVLPSREAVPILGIRPGESRSSCGSGRHPNGRKPRERVPSGGYLRPRDSTRPEPEGRGGRPVQEQLYWVNTCPAVV
jgi:hypothetical protein